MLLRALMLNPPPRQATTRPLGGSYFDPTGDLRTVTWDPAVLRLTDAATGVHDGVLGGVSSNAFVGISQAGTLRVYRVDTAGLVTPPAATYPNIATPDGWTRKGVLANGDVLFIRTVDGVTQVSAYNAASQTQGPVIPLLNSTVVTNGDNFLASTALGTNPAPTPYRFASSSDPGAGGGFNRLVVSFARDDETAPRVRTVGSGGVADLSFVAPPFWYARQGTTIVRQADVVLGETALQRAGLVYIPMSARTWEFALDEVTGRQGVRDIRKFRKAQRVHFGFLRIGGQAGAVFISGATQDTALDGTCEQWPGTGEYVLRGLNSWSAANEQTLGFADWNPIGALSGGIVLMSVNAGKLRYVPFGGSPVDRPLPINLPVVLPHLDALVVADANNYGSGQISFDAGATWTIIGLRRSAFAGIPPSGTNIPPSRLCVPLYPL